MKQKHTDTADIGSLVDDAKALLSATAEVAEGNVVAARKKLAAALESGEETWGKVQDFAVESAKSADKTIRTHPYQSIGIAFGIGAVLGYLLSRRNND